MHNFFQIKQFTQCPLHTYRRICEKYFLYKPKLFNTFGNYSRLTCTYECTINMQYYAQLHSSAIQQLSLKMSPFSVMLCTLLTADQTSLPNSTIYVHRWCRYALRIIFFLTAMLTENP